MSKNKQNQVKKTEKKWLLPALCGAFVLAIAVMAVVLVATTPPDFVPPPFEENAVAGVPENVPDDLRYTVHYKTGMPYSVSTCTRIKTEGREAVVYFTSDKDNEKYLKLRVYDSDGNILGDTGLLHAGEYVRTVSLTRELDVGEVITLKVMGYEPDTYQSAGAIRITVEVVE